MKKRRNPAAAREKRTIVERGYFHTGNSGISVSMIEDVRNADWDEEDRDWYEHFLEIRHSAFGAGSSFRTPIAGPAMCQYYIEAFTRLRDRMVADPKYKIPHPFERYGYEDVPTTFNINQKYKKTSESYRIVDIADGLNREEVWSEEIVDSEYSTTKRLLGHNFTDENGVIVRFEKFVKGSYAFDESSGSDCSPNCGPVYAKSDIGKPVSTVDPLPQKPIQEIELEDDPE